MVDILLNNMVTLSLIFGMLCLTLYNKTLDRRISIDFLIFVIIVLVIDLADMADWYFSQGSETIVQRYITSALTYSLRPIAVAIVADVFLKRQGRSKIFFWVPAGINAIFCLTSPFTKLVFFFSEGNGYQGGPLWSLPYVVSVLHLIILLYFMIRFSGADDITEILIIVFVIGINSIAVFLTHFMSLGNDKNLVTQSMIVSCVIYYIYMNVEVYRKDVLTGVLNRRSFYQDASKLKKHPLLIVSMDLNGLKPLNDTHGHQAGDIALKTVSSVCVRTAGRKFRWYRTGGDEFIAISRGVTEEDAREYIAETMEAISQTPYTASFGYALCLQGDDFDASCRAADEMMYKDKSRYPHRRNDVFLVGT